MRSLNLNVLSKRFALVSIALVFFLSGWALNHKPAANVLPPDPGSVTWTHLANLYIACEDYKRLRGSWPPTIQWLTNTVALSSPGDLTDGWGGTILLMPLTNSAGAMLLISYGADGVPGGSGTNFDLHYVLR